MNQKPTHSCIFLGARPEEVLVKMDAIDKALQAQAARKAARDNEAALARALYKHQCAQEWPRCGQGWPATAAERTATALMVKCGAFDD